MKTEIERSTAKPSDRYYLGLWLSDRDENQDLLACAWRDGDQWFCRSRFRYFVAPQRESRYAVNVKADSDSEAFALLNNGFKEVGKFTPPIRYIPIHGNAEAACGTIFGHNLLEQAWNISGMPVLYQGQALTASIAAARRDPQYADLIRKYGNKTEEQMPNEIRMWTLDLDCVLPNPSSDLSGQNSF